MYFDLLKYANEELYKTSAEKISVLPFVYTLIYMLLLLLLLLFYTKSSLKCLFLYTVLQEHGI